MNKFTEQNKAAAKIDPNTTTAKTDAAAKTAKDDASNRQRHHQHEQSGCR